MKNGNHSLLCEMAPNYYLAILARSSVRATRKPAALIGGHRVSTHLTFEIKTFPCPAPDYPLEQGNKFHLFPAKNKSVRNCETASDG